MDLMDEFGVGLRGFEVTENLAGIPTAFSGRFGSGHPVIGVLAEFDALSGLSQEGGVTEKRSAGGACGHGCGHNLLGTASLGAAIAIKRFLETQTCSGTVILFGCPRRGGRLRQGVHGARRRV